MRKGKLGTSNWKMDVKQGNRQNHKRKIAEKEQKDKGMVRLCKSKVDKLRLAITAENLLLWLRKTTFRRAADSRIQGLQKEQLQNR
jgi:hypothetical protein